MILKSFANFLAFCFHSTKEGFKVRDQRYPVSPMEVSIPPRKVSRPIGTCSPAKKTQRFPFHQGRFQGKAAHDAGHGFGESFHSTKEGFKAGMGEISMLERRGFHSTKEGFKEPVQGHQLVPSHCVSIPPRKVSRTILCPPNWGEAGLVSIPPRKVSRALDCCGHVAEQLVSIPPRKVSRTHVPASISRKYPRFPFHQGRFQGALNAVRARQCPSFHSTKEGFKDDPLPSKLGGSWTSFHSTKEGFKGPRLLRPCSRATCFHSTKEGFKDSCPCLHFPEVSPVSIPPRKVSRGVECSARPAMS